MAKHNGLSQIELMGLFPNEKVVDAGNPKPPCG